MPRALPPRRLPSAHELTVRGRGSSFPDRPLQYRDRPIDLLPVDDQRGREANRREAARQEHKAVAEAIGQDAVAKRRIGRAGCSIDDEVDGEHQSLAPDVADGLETVRKLAQLSDKVRS